MRRKKRISFFLLLSVSFFIFLIFCTSISIFAASSDQQIVWQLASWNTSLTVCSLMIDSEIQPGEQEILEQCGPEILFEWQTTSHVIISSKIRIAPVCFFEEPDRSFHKMKFPKKNPRIPLGLSHRSDLNWSIVCQVNSVNKYRKFKFEWSIHPLLHLSR